MHIIKLYWEVMLVRVNGAHRSVCVSMQYITFPWYDSWWLLVFDREVLIPPVQLCFGIDPFLCEGWYCPSLCGGWYGWQLFVLMIFLTIVLNMQSLRYILVWHLPEWSCIIMYWCVLKLASSSYGEMYSISVWEALLKTPHTHPIDSPGDIG